MKKSLIILATMLALPFAALRAQTEDEQEITEIQLNDHYSVKLRQISASEYTARKNESEHLQHKPYKVIADLKEAQKMLGNKLKEVTVKDEDGYERSVIEITFKDKTKKRISWEWGFNLDGFREYYPEVDVLVFENEAVGDYAIDLNDSKKDYERTGNPRYHAVSPDKKLRINGYYPGGAVDGALFFLEKWNPKKRKYEFIGYFENQENYVFTFIFTADYFWTSNSKAVFRLVTYPGGYYEMEIIEIEK